MYSSTSSFDDLAVRMQQLDQARDGLAHGLLVAARQMRAEPEVALGNVDVARLAQSSRKTSAR